MRVNNLCGSGQFSGFYMNDAAIEEVTFTTGAESAEMQTGGLRINSTPKDGGNTLLRHVLRLWRRQRLAGRQPLRRDEDRSGAIPQPGIAYTWQINPSFGGPIMRDKLWFYFTYKYEDNKTYVAELDVRRRQPRVSAGMGNYSGVGRLTWQAIAARQDPLLSRSPVQRRVLQRLQHAADHHARSVDRRVRPRLGAAGQVDADHHRTSCCSRPASYYNQPYEQNYRDTSARAICRGSNRPPTG